TMSLGLRTAIFATLPVAVGMIALAAPLVRLMFERGVFTREATEAVAAAVAAYAVGLPAISAYYILTRVYYALHDMKTPVKVGASMVALNAVANLVLMRVLGHTGIALATSLVAITNVGILLWRLHRRLGNVDGPRIGRATLGFAVPALAAGLAIAGVGSLAGKVVDLHRLSGQALQVGAAISGGAAVYLALCRALGVEELRTAVGLLRPSRLKE
ncbi:MAG: polysaccharide biosynthesis C-terminal domain-containing protein, partial [Armatimonadetes bacterium]|nr:polysaccharide biosynthesis C-terminal domain-containing protein [Armatimonadota bacterium]